jgi:hypothetical protein
MIPDQRASPHLSRGHHETRRHAFHALTAADRHDSCQTSRVFLTAPLLQTCIAGRRRPPNAYLYNKGDIKLPMTTDLLRAASEVGSSCSDGILQELRLTSIAGGTTPNTSAYCMPTAAGGRPPRSM